MCRVRTTGPLQSSKLFNVKLRLMRRTDHKNSTIMLLYCQLFWAFFNLSYNLQEIGTRVTTGTVYFVTLSL